MNVSFIDFGLYNVDVAYLRYLNSIEPEVQFSEDKDYVQKKTGVVHPIYCDFTKLEAASRTYSSAK
jgi:hypothetical protein